MFNPGELDYNKSRSPHGERGLKLKQSPGAPTLPLSLPTRGAWIETQFRSPYLSAPVVAPHTGSVD